jgi:DNA-binding CsgD family transcriptional regulator
VGDAGKDNQSDPFGDLLKPEVARAWSKLRSAGRVPMDQAAEFLGGDEIVAELDARGLAREMPHMPDGEPVFRAASTELALAAVLTGLLGQATVTHERVLDCIKRLAEALAAPQADDFGDFRNCVRVLTDPEEIAAHSGDLINSAQRDYMSLEPVKTELPVTDNCAVTQAPALRGNVRVRAIYDRASAENPAISRAMELTRRAGEQARVLPEVLVKMLLVDESAALIALTETGSRGALLIRNVAPVLRALRQYFEMLWEQAMPVGGEQVPAGCPLADDEYVVLREMAKGLKDEAIATKLGISKSTVGRRVTEIYKHTKVSNRFACGMAVQQLGWLADPGEQKEA